MTARRTRHASIQSFLQTWVVVSLCGCGSVTSTVGAEVASAPPINGSRPVIRIAHLYDNVETEAASIPVAFMMEKFRNAAQSRALLPDFDVVVDCVPYSSLPSADAPAELVKVLLAKRPYHAVAGPWHNADCLLTVPLTAQASVLHVVKGENAEFSYQRETFPYVFRTLRSMDGIVHSWMYILAQNRWLSTLSLWTEAPTVDLANLFADKYGIANTAILAASSNKNSPEWLSEAWQEAAIWRMRKQLLRVVMTYLEAVEDMYGFACRAHRARLGGIQYFIRGTYEPGWFLHRYSEHLGDCTPDEIYVAVGGYISTLHMIIAPGINATIPGYQAYDFPPIDGIEDQSQLPLTCVPGMTAQQWYASGELLWQGFLAGIVNDEPSAQRFLGASSSEIYMICVILVALHDALYNKGITLERIEHRDMATFQALIDSTSKVDIQGPAGYLRFYNNSGDPEVIYYILTQPGLPGARNDTAVLTATITYPGGPYDAPPDIQLWDENQPLQWRDGSTGLGPRPHLGFFPDCGTLNAVLEWDPDRLYHSICVLCAPGKAYDSLLDDCRTCPTGSHQSEPGTSSCLSTPPGWYVANTSAPIEALPCPAGHECPQAGTVKPNQCPRGRFANESGLSECELCPIGRYQEATGSTACDPCELVVAESTTINIASTSPLQCVCASGSFRPTAEERCALCPKGMRCPEGSDMQNLWGALVAHPYPEVQEGYMTLASDPLRVYLCKATRHCPGGLPGSCAKRRDPSSVACGECVDDAYESGDVCEACGRAGALPIIFVSLLGLLVIAVISVAINRDVHRTPASSLTIVAITAMLIMSLQALGVFNQLSIPWHEPVKSLLHVSQLITFDLRLLQSNCVFGVDPLRSFAVHQLLPVLVVPVIIGALFLKKKIFHTPGHAFGIRAQTINATGTLYNLFFISIVISALGPFVCYKHPDSNGESVLSAPSLLCFDSDAHTLMIITSLASFCVVPVPFLALSGYGVLMYPKKINSFDNTMFLHAFRFLFFRYRPQCYYFQCILLARSLMLCLIPALLRAQPATQVLCMCIVLGSYSVCVSQLRSWRSGMCTPLDASMNVMLSIILTCGGLFLEENPHRDALAVLTTVAIILLLGLALAAILVAVKRRLLPSPYYDFFICHHKAHAAAQARFIKLLLQSKRINSQVFVDSDNLKELDTLFDLVKCRVNTFVAYLTSETLKRPWCVGELVSAVMANVKIVRLQTSSFVKPPDEQLEEPEGYVDTFGCNLSEYGIQWYDVTESFHHFVYKVAPISVSETAPGTRRFDLAASMLLNQRITEDLAPRLEHSPYAGVVVVTDTGSDEANAAAGVLLAQLTKVVFQVCDQSCCLLADYVHDVKMLQERLRSAAVAIVILSAGCLEVEEFLTALCELELRQHVSSAIAIPVNLPDFVFPCAQFYRHFTNTMPGLFAQYGEEATTELVKGFFKRISIPLPTHASQSALDIQTREVFTRVKRCLANASMGSAFRKGRSTTPGEGSMPSSAMSLSFRSSSKCSASFAAAGLSSDIDLGSRLVAHSTNMDGSPSPARLSASDADTVALQFESSPLAHRASSSLKEDPAPPLEEEPTNVQQELSAPSGPTSSYSPVVATADADGDDGSGAPNLQRILASSTGASLQQSLQSDRDCVFMRV